MNAYSITAPEEIAKKYGGNKKKIQQAATQGLINPTEAVMAGMFIDRMRNAAMQEQAQQPTVAEQVMNPQPQMPPQGMAATPQAQQMAQRPPQMGMPQAPQQMPPQGMAMGGGLDAIPYNEGDYAEGGIVSFNQGGGGFGEAMAQLRRQLGAARTQAQRDEITSAMAQLRAQYEQPSIEPKSQDIDDFVRQNVGQRIRQGLGKLGDSLQAGFNAFTSAFDSGDSEEFARLKNAQSSEVPGEEARLARVAAMTNKQPAGVEAIASPDDLMSVGMEPPADSGQGAISTEQTAPMRSTDLTLPARQNIISSMTPDQVIANEIARGKTGRGSIVEQPGERDAYNLSRSGSGRGSIVEQPGERVGQITKPTVQQQVEETQKQTADFTGLGQESESGEETAAAANAAAGTPAERNKQMIDPNETVDQYITRMMGQLPKEAEGPLTTRLKDRIANQAENMKGAKKDAMWMAVLETGVGMLAQGGGQTMFQALGKAAGPALKNYASTLKDIKKEDLDLLKHGVAMEAADKKAKAEITKQLVSNFGAEQTARINRESQERISDARNKVLAEGYRIQADAQNLDVKGLSALIAKDRKARGMPALSQNELYGLAQMTLEQNKNFRAQQTALTARMPALQQKANEAAAEAVAEFMDIQVGAQNPQRTRYDQLDQELRAERDPAKQAQIQNEMNTILEEIRTKARANAMQGVIGGINQAPSPLIIGTGADGSAIGSNADVNARIGNYQ